MGLRRRRRPDELGAVETIPTTVPGETIARAAAFFEREGPVAALGIGCFDPVDLARRASDHDDPEAGLGERDEVGRPRGDRLGVPVAFETDVNEAALGERRDGAAQGLDTFG